MFSIRNFYSNQLDRYHGTITTYSNVAPEASFASGGTEMMRDGKRSSEYVAPALEI